LKTSPNNPFHKVLSYLALQEWRVYGNNSDDGNGAGSSESTLLQEQDV